MLTAEKLEIIWGRGKKNTDMKCSSTYCNQMILIFSFLKHKIFLNRFSYLKIVYNRITSYPSENAV